MSSRLFQCRAAFVGMTLLALLGACGGSTAGTPTSSAHPIATASQVASSTAAPLVAPSDAPGSLSSGQDTGAACTIVTKDAVAQAVGFAINTVSGVDSICYFQNADLSKYAVIKLYANQADMAEMLQIEAGSEHIAGLGDDAFWVPVVGILFVRHGDHAMQISDSKGALTVGSDTSLKAALTTLARTALPKL
jgi:hypothetical protein